MAQKLLTLEEAAQALGLSVDEVNRLRESRELSGMRDGSSWKFKESEIERVRQSLGAKSPADDEFEMSFDLEDDAESADVVLLSDRELGGSSLSTSSTVIGKPGEGQSPEASDIELVIDEADVTGSDVKLVPDDAGASGLKLVSDKPTSDPASVFDEDEAPLPALAEDEDSEIEFDLGDSKLPLAAEKPPGPGSDISLDDASLDIALGNELDLGDEPASPAKKTGASDIHDDLALGFGSDVTRSPADSGISLANPADSGLSLEEPLKLDAASDDIELELGAGQAFQLDEDSDSQEVAELPAEDNFLLTPLEEVAEADSDDSGSQVIDIPEDSSFGADVGGALGGGLLEEDVLGAPAVAAGPAVGIATQGAPLAAAREAQYTTMQIVALCFCLFVVGLSGMLTYDLARQIWSWDQPYSLSSTLMDLVVK